MGRVVLQGSKQWTCMSFTTMNNVNIVLKCVGVGLYRGLEGVLVEMSCFVSFRRHHISRLHPRGVYRNVDVIVWKCIWLAMDNNAVFSNKLLSNAVFSNKSLVK